MSELVRGLPQHPDLPSFLAAMKFSPSEIRVAIQIVHGFTNKEAAHNLSVGEKTVKFHLTNIYRKCRVKTRLQLVAICYPHLGKLKPFERPSELVYGVRGTKY